METLDEVMEAWNDRRQELMATDAATDWTYANILEASIWMDRLRNACLRKKPGRKAKLRLEGDTPE